VAKQNRDWVLCALQALERRRAIVHEKFILKNKIRKLKNQGKQ